MTIRVKKSDLRSMLRLIDEIKDKLLELRR